MRETIQKPTAYELGIIIWFVVGFGGMGLPILVVWELLAPVGDRLVWETIYLIGVAVGSGPTWVLMYYSEAIGEYIEATVRGL